MVITYTRTIDVMKRYGHCVRWPSSGACESRKSLGNFEPIVQGCRLFSFCCQYLVMSLPSSCLFLFSDCACLLSV